MNIPQITRERLASSAVGTPGVDTSGQAIGMAIAKAGEEIAAPAWDYLKKEQEMKDASEYSALIGQHKTNLINAEDNIKTTYASNPENAVSAVLEADKKSLEAVTQQASNPRVKLMLAKGSPGTSVASLRNVATWKSRQESENLVKGTQAMMNESAGRLAPIGANLSLTPQGMMEAAGSEIDLLATKVNEIKYSKNPELAKEVEYKGMQNILRSIIDPAMEYQPIKAQEIINNPEMARYFKPEELEKYRKDVATVIDNFPEKILKQDIQKDLQRSTQLVQDSLGGKLKFQDIYAAEKKDAWKLHPETYKYLGDIALGVGGKTEVASRDSLKATIMANASELGFKLGSDPTKLTGKDSKAAGNAAIMSNTVKDLYRLQDDILHAATMGVLSPEEAKKYHDWLYVPLVNAVMQKTDPNYFDELVKKSGGPLGALTGGIAGAGVALFGMGLPKKVTEFQTANKIVEGYLTRNNMAKDYTNKTAFFEAYFKAADAKLKPGVLNPKTNTPYTPADIAHSVVGEGIGETVNTRFGPKVISGYNPKTGAPGWDATPEEQGHLNADNLLMKLWKDLTKNSKEK